MIASLPHYIYTQDEDNIYMHLYIGNETKLQHRGQQIALQVKTVYPWDGKVSVTIEQEQSSRFGLALRIPGWCRQSTIKVNGESLDVNEICRNGYAVIDRTWGTHDQVEIEFSMPVERIQSHPRVRENAGKVALQRGPLVYCLEEVDNGDNLPAISLPLEGKLEACYDKELLEGIVIIKGEGMRLDESSWKDDCLYRPMENTEKPVTITAVPYFIWGNRKPGEVMVWIRCK